MNCIELAACCAETTKTLSADSGAYIAEIRSRGWQAYRFGVFSEQVIICLHLRVYDARLSTTTTTDMARGAFIVLEGLDRSGKSTQVDRLIKRLNDSGRKARLQKFPGAFDGGIGAACNALDTR